MYHRKVLTYVELFQTLLSMYQPRGIVGRNRSVKIVCLELDLGNFIASQRAERIARSMQVGRVRERAASRECEISIPSPAVKGAEGEELEAGRRMCRQRDPGGDIRTHSQHAPRAIESRGK